MKQSFRIFGVALMAMLILVASPSAWTQTAQDKKNAHRGSATSSTPSYSSIPLTNANASSTDYTPGEVVNNYVEANNSTAYDSNAVSRARNICSSGSLRAVMMWEGSYDFDLIANQANGTDIYYAHRTDSSYGTQHGGDNSNGSEYIYWTNPGTGIYDLFVRVRGNLPSNGTLVTLVVTQNGNSSVYKTRIKKSGGDFEDVRLLNFRYEGSSSSGSNTSSSGSYRTNISGSTNSYSFGSVVSSYVPANVNSAYNYDAVSRAIDVGSATSNLSATLFWDASNDLDLIVNQSNQTDIYYGNRTDSSSGANHYGDDTGGSGSYEKIKWSSPGHGIYDIFVRVRGTVPSGGIPVTLVVLSGTTADDLFVYRTTLYKGGSSSNDVRLVSFRYGGSGNSGLSGSTSTSSSSSPITNANGSTRDYTIGDVVSSYVNANTSEAYDSNAVSRANNIAWNSPLKVTLLWSGNSDLDLIVNEADCTDIYYGNRSHSSTGAQHQGDNTGETNANECITWGNPRSGYYNVFVRTRYIPSGGLPIKLVVTKNGSSTVYSTTIQKSGTDAVDVRIADFNY